MTETLVVVNPHAASGRAAKVWQELSPILISQLKDPLIAITQSPAELFNHIQDACASGIKQLISIGGDGTNHAIVNTLIGKEFSSVNQPLIYGNVPVGTGRDWARMLEIPQDMKKIPQWLAEANPMPVDVGQLVIDGGKTSHFLNIASAGISGDIDQRVNEIKHRKPWTFLSQTLAALLHYDPKILRVEVDGKLWFEGKAFIVAVANGTTFGHGMKIAPSASINDALFDVVLVEAMPLSEVLITLPRLYNGSHIYHPKCKMTRGEHVRIQSDSVIGLDLDGEASSAKEAQFEIIPQALQFLR
ncbi:diacylglycerol kinase family lipid kinase [Anaerolineales bacterium]